MLKAFFVGFFALALVSCGGGDANDATPVISVQNATLRLPAPGQTKGAAYFDVINLGGKDVLLSAATPFSSRVELHTHLHEDGMMKMRQVDNVDIDPETVTHFKTGGLHVMIFDMEVPEGAAHMPLTLNFAKSGTVEVNVMIGEAGAMSEHKMGGHKMENKEDTENHDMHKGD